jgi:hypothetical protein
VADIALAAEGTIEKAVNEVDCTIEQVEQTGHTDEGVNLVAVDAAKNFDFEVAIDFAG